MKISVLPLVYSLAGTWSVYIFPLLSAQAHASEVEANPMSKAIELLGYLSDQIAKEGKVDHDIYLSYHEYYSKEVKTTDAAIKEHGDKIAQLESDLKEAQAFRDGKHLEFADLIKKQTETSTELTAAKEQRRKERELFEINEDSYAEAHDVLRRSLVTMKKGTPEGYVATAAAASLLSVAQGLKDTLMHSSDVSLSVAQQQTLDSFVRTVQTQTVNRHGASFLQHRSGRPYGEFKTDSGGVVGILQDLLDKVEEERRVARETEQKAKAEFKELSGVLATTLTNIEKSMADIKVSIAQSTEESSRKTIALMKSREIFKAAVTYRAEIEDVFRKKTSCYKNRLVTRSDELVAVHEAQRMLSSEISKSYIKKQRIGTAASASFAQAREKATVRRKASHVLKHATTPGMALLALKAAHFKRAKDPFVDVRSMIKVKLRDLYTQDAKESTQAAFCDREMMRAASSEKTKGEDIEKMNIRDEALTAEIAETENDLSTESKDLKELEETMNTAVAVRQKEHKVAGGSEQQYKAASKLMREAIKVLSKYYRKDKYQKTWRRDSEQHKVQHFCGTRGHVTWKNDVKQRRGVGTVIIGILEIAADDFDLSYEEAKGTEGNDAKDFTALHTESAVRVAAFKSELERDTGTKADLELNQNQLKNDFKTKENELKKVGDYLGKLKASCMFNADDYMQKKVKRASLLKSLNEVLSYLKGAR